MAALFSALFALCSAISLGLALFIYAKNPKSLEHRYFAAGALFLLGWLVTLYIFDRTSNPAYLTLLGRINIASMLPAVVCGYLLICTLLETPIPLAGLFWVETVVLAILTVATPALDRMEIVRNGQHITLFGPLYILNILHVVGYLTAAILTALIGVRRASREVRRQLAIVGVGLAASTIVAVTCDLILPYLFHIFAFQEVGALSTLFYLAAVAYAISFLNLFDIRILLKRTLVFTLLLGFILFVYSGLVLLLAQSLPGFGEGWPHTLLTLIAILVIAFSFDPLRRWLEVKTERFLFRREIETQQILQTLAQALAEVAELDAALSTVLTTIEQNLHPAHIVAFAFGTEKADTPVLKRMAKRGYASSSHPFLRELELLQHSFQSDMRPLVIAEESENGGLSGHATQERTSLVHLLNERGIAVVVPISVGTHLLGLLLIGEKRSGERFAEAEVTLIKAIGTQLAGAIQKAQLVESDQSKTEFVSITSHELRTPLVAAQGYLSMVLDEHLGTVDTQAERYIGKARTALERLSTLVNDLLEVSRLEAGRIAITLQAVSIEPLIADVIEQVTPIAREKGLQLTFEYPTSPLSAVWIDPTRTIQVLINLIGNAIKYTPSGSVTVTATLLRASDHAHQAVVEVIVADTGMGMDTTELKHLFEKFYRTPEAQTSGIQGTGLGLYITKQIVEKMGGTLLVESTIGKGSIFRLRLSTHDTIGISTPG